MKKSPCCCPVCKVAGLLVVLGAVNWGLVGAINYNLVGSLLGAGSTAEKVVYIVIGVAGVLKLLSCFITCPCAKKCDAPAPAEHKHGKGEGGCCGH
ncbi:MAG: hypothetical protein MOGMAGMI_01617 [Candidatus Omnitrophica bacterium]|nr:hypothetical protein [Candidatus Omnitrophota bacterium]